MGVISFQKASHQIIFYFQQVRKERKKNPWDGENAAPGGEIHTDYFRITLLKFFLPLFTRRPV